MEQPQMETSSVQPSTFPITIAYNGTPRSLDVSAHELVSVLLQRALHLFNIRDRPHVYALFRMNGEIVPDNVTLHAAGIVPHTELILREKQVQGG
jgi:hypothetical protein